MITCGIDPGYDRLGVAIFKGKGLIFSTCLTSVAKAPFADRLYELGEQLAEIFQKYQPQNIALEELYFSKNQTTALKVAEARGLVTYLAKKHGAEVHHYSPQAIKLSVAGYGNAPKDQVINMTKRLVKLPTPAKYDDEYDAIAVGLTHLSHYGSL